MGDSHALKRSKTNKYLSGRNSCNHYHHDPGFIIPNPTTFYCYVCSLQFGNAEELAKHCMNHNENIDQECLICSQKFQEKNALRSHFISHDLQEILGLCINVKKTVPRRPKNSKLKKLFCKLCGHVSKTVKTFNEHLSTHVPKLCYLCHVCDQTFVSSVFLEDHLKTHLREEVHIIAYHTQQLQSDQIAIHNSVIKDMKNNPDEIDLDNSFYCHFCCSLIHHRKDIHIEKYHAKCYNNIAHKCYICGGFFDSEELLRDHIKEFIYPPSWPVVNKERDESTISSLNQELPDLIEVSEPNFENEVLSNGVGEEESEKTLLKCDTDSRKTIICELCGKLFSSTFLLQYHVKHNHSCSCGKCLYCKKAQPSNQIQDSSNNFKVVTCSICKMSFLNRSQLHRHSKSKHPNNRKPFKCKDCEETFGAVNTLRVHQRNEHPLTTCTCAEENDVCQACIMAKEKNYKCSFCNKGFKIKSSMKIHEKIHLGTTRKRVLVCHVCGKKYNSQSSFYEHLESHKNPCRCGNCEICKNLNPKHQCEVCKKIFLTNEKLKRHVIIHSGERPHVCEICGKGFNQNGNLLVHLKSHKRREKKT